MRTGPTMDTPIQWVYRRAGLPVEVLKEIEGWRQVRDGEGTTGWISSALLSNRRTVQIAPWEEKTPSGQRPIIEIRAETSTRSAATALVEAGVIASLTSCDGTWCRVTVGDARGYIEQKKLWGVYPSEIVK
jgi:SH3-like domain-containing protein